MNKKQTNTKEEIWKTIPIEGKYSVSTFGNVRNDQTKSIYARSVKNSYLYVTMRDNEGKNHSYRVHRLVAQAFIPNDDPKKTEVNHINGDKLNCSVDNLEWMTPSENIKHACDTGLLKSQARQVRQLDKKGNLIKTFDSIAQASKETGIDDGTICKVAKGTCKNKTAGGYVWKYVDDTKLCQEEFEIDEDDEAKEIDGFPEYSITKSGKVYSHKRKRFLEVNLLDGYERVYITNSEGRSGFMMHQLVGKTFIKNDDPEHKLQVDHLNGIKTDNHMENLEWVTNQENNRRKGLRQKAANATKVATEKSEKISLNKVVKEYDKIDLDKGDEEKVILNFPDYSITKSGKVYSHKRGRFLEPNLSDGAHRVYLTNTEGRSGIMVHQLVANAFIANDDPDGKKQVRHINGIRTDNQANNLEWASDINHPAKQKPKVVLTKEEIIEKKKDNGIKLNLGSISKK